MIGGATLALTGLARLRHKHLFPGLAMLAAGSMFLYRGKTGHCDMYEAIGVSTAGSSETGVTVEKTLTINRSSREVYDFWRNFSNLPRFMRYLDSVRMTGDRTSHWKAKVPGGISLEWDAETTEDSPGRISWHSIGDADIHNEGSVHFKDAPGGRGTEMTVTLAFYPPGGTLGRVAGRLLSSITTMTIEEDLRNFKQIIETGETSTSAFAA
jgi:uncharacterized membrane protein